MPELDDDLLEFFPEDFLNKANKPSKAAERRNWRSAIQEELEDLGDLYELPEGLQIPGVRL